MPRHRKTRSSDFASNENAAIISFLPGNRQSAKRHSLPAFTKRLSNTPKNVLMRRSALQPLQIQSAQRIDICFTESPCSSYSDFKHDSALAIETAPQERLVEETKLWFDQLEEAEDSLRAHEKQQDRQSSIPDVAPTPDLLDAVWTGFLDEADEESLSAASPALLDASDLAAHCSDMSLAPLYAAAPKSTSATLSSETVMPARSLPRRLSSLPPLPPKDFPRVQPLNLSSLLPRTSYQEHLDPPPNSAPLVSRPVFFPEARLDRPHSYNPVDSRNSSARTSCSFLTITEAGLMTPKDGQCDGLGFDFGDWSNCKSSFSYQGAIQEEEEVEWGLAM